METKHQEENAQPKSSNASSYRRNNIRIKQQLARLDSDKDGYLSLEESYIPTEIFHHVDLDMDGLLSADELIKISKASKEKIQELTSMVPSESSTNFIYMQDKDGDEKISLKEFGYSKSTEFKRLDKNGDGFITESDLNSTFKD